MPEPKAVAPWRLALVGPIAVTGVLSLILGSLVLFWIVASAFGDLMTGGR